MFRVDNNQTIRINKFDEAKFGLFLNVGTVTCPVRYDFAKPQAKLTYRNPETISISVNEDIFIKKAETPGLYTFTQTILGWELNGNIVNLLEYGVSVVASSIGSSFNICYSIGTGCEIYFMILKKNQKLNSRPLLLKTFKETGEIITQAWSDVDDSITYDNIVTTDNYDPIISLESTDTKYLAEMEYRYLIRAKLLDKSIAIQNADGTYDDRYYRTHTITNKHPFYVIDDDYNRSFDYD